MRRKAGELTLDQAHEVIEAAEHAVLATCDAEGFPYAVPVSPVMVGDAIYFHLTGLPGGRKADNMLMNPNASLCFIAQGHDAAAMVFGRLCLCGRHREGPSGHG